MCWFRSRCFSWRTMWFFQDSADLRPCESVRTARAVPVTAAMTAAARRGLGSGERSEPGCTREPSPNEAPDFCSSSRLLLNFCRFSRLRRFLVPPENRARARTQRGARPRLCSSVVFALLCSVGAEVLFSSHDMNKWFKRHRNKHQFDGFCVFSYFYIDAGRFSESVARSRRFESDSVPY